MSKKIIVVQTGVGGVRQDDVNSFFPEIAENITCTMSFNTAKAMIPKEGEVIVITSHVFHDFDVCITRTNERSDYKPDNLKNGNTLARVVKEINPKAKVYVFSSDAPGKDHIDGFYKKRSGGFSGREQLKEVFQDLGLVEKLKVLPEKDVRLEPVEQLESKLTAEWDIFKFLKFWKWFA